MRLEERLDCGGTSNSPVVNIVADGIVQLIDTTSLTNVRFPDGWIRVSFYLFFNGKSNRNSKWS